MDSALPTARMTDLERYQRIMEGVTQLKINIPGCDKILDQTALFMVKRLCPDLECELPIAQPACDEVFNTPELLERILLNLGISSLLKVQQVNRHFSDNITGSIQLRWLMGLESDTKHNFRLTHSVYKNPFPYRLLVPHHLSEQPKKAAGDNVMFAAMIPAGWNPKFGKRARSVLVCQPPVKSLDLYTDCCNHSYSYPNTGQPDGKPTVILESSTGITFGDLLDAYHKLQAQHRTCPHAYEFMHDALGWVEIGVHAEGIVPVSASDPAIQRRDKRLRDRAEDDRRRAAKHDRLAPYLQAKTAAHVAGMTIPTLAEFEETLLPTPVLNPDGNVESETNTETDSSNGE